MILFLTFAVIFVSVYMLSDFFLEQGLPFLMNTYNKIQSRRTGKLKAQMEESFVFWEEKRMMLIYLSPVIFAGLGFILLRHILGAVAGFIAGIAFPSFMVKMAYKKRIKKFQSQLVDGLQMLASSLKAGLSFIQAIEVLCEEMPPPISQEFKLILKENKWGMSLEESLIKLRQRIPLEETNLFVSSILIARESGGELPKVLMRLTSTIRDNIKLQEKIATFTLQGRLQGIIMVFLPIGFSYFVYKQNPDHFTVMLQTSIGRLFLIVAIVLQIVGTIIVKKVSTIRV